MRWILASIFCGAAILASADRSAAQSPPAKTETGSVKFAPLGDQAKIPARYRLDAHHFEWTMTPKADWPVIGVEMLTVQFPSPVTTKVPENNTVHAEYYRPKSGGPHPAVIVLDITGGNQKLSRTIARHLAQNGIGGLFVQMAYYGPRRPPGSKVRLLSTDVDQTIEGVRQTVLDLRRATAFLESRPEVDPKQLGIMGTSLGSFVAALTGEMEPKLGKVCVLLGGGGFVDAYWHDARVTPFRLAYELTGGNRKKIEDWIAPVDPITHAELLRDRKVLIVGAKNDEIVPAKMAENLWRASGEQKIIWLDAGHFTAAVYLFSSLSSVVEHFGPTKTP
jgi:predicted esterase